jgi:hypothetical protein
MLSIAVPLAIAVSASILSLAVIYTIDWSPSVRIKGVLMLLGLAYFTAVSLYFLKKEMVEWVKRTFDNSEWITFNSQIPPDEYSVRMPRPPSRDDNHQPVPGIQLECYTLSHKDSMGEFVSFVVGGGTPQGGNKNPQPGAVLWFDRTIDSIVVESKGQLDPDQPTQSVQGPPAIDCVGREFGIKLGDDKTMRIVRVFVINGRVYYLSVEGTGLTRDDPIVGQFFRSFEVRGRKK